MSARVLFIGGMDSSGGAGLLRDAVTAAELGAASAAAVTAVTVQSDGAVTAVRKMPPDLVAAQIAAGCAGGVGAVKIGMLGSAAIVRAVAAALPAAPMVLDPVLAASSGRSLLEAEGLEALLEGLLPRTALLTPNLPELARIGQHLGLGPGEEEGAVAAALLRRGCAAVLVKGGHGAEADLCEDRLYLGGGAPLRFAGPRHSGSLRGTGCRLASAVAVHLAQGAALEAAVAAARGLIQRHFEKAALR